MNNGIAFSDGITFNIVINKISKDNKSHERWICFYMR